MGGGDDRGGNSGGGRDGGDNGDNGGNNGGDNGSNAAAAGGEGGGPQKNAISPFFDASGNINIGATIRISQMIWCRPYAGFFNNKKINSFITKSPRIFLEDILFWGGAFGIFCTSTNLVFLFTSSKSQLLLSL